MSTLSSAMAAAGTALTAERVRIETAVSNLANAQSTRGGTDGKPYRRRDVVLAAEAVDPFATTLDQAGAVGVRVAEVVEDKGPFRVEYDPTHADARKDGYVELPNVDPVEETVDMVTAARAYQANLAAVTVIRDIVQRSLELGR
jgi:flagellar basal-body rod protein FlgC